MNRRKTVLVVDDDADFVEMNKVVLEENGYEVITAYSGQECLEKTRTQKPDLIILDVMMATNNEGFDVSRQIHHYCEATKDIPIIMVTSINQKYPFHFGPDEVWLPVESFVEKPVQPEQLLREVSKQIGE